LGIEKVIGISAKKERNISELEDDIIEFSKKWIDEHPDQEDDKALDIPQHK
jgi:hemerythrin